MSTVILAATASALPSSDHTVRGINRANGTHAHFTAPGIASGETATVQKKNADDSYSDYYINAQLQQITVDNTGVVVDAAGVYRVNKSVTAALVGVEVSTPDVP